MFNKIYNSDLELDLQLFAEGAGDSGTSAAAADAGQAGTVTETQTESGDNTNAAGSEEGAVTSRADQYKQIRQDFKQEFDAEIQQAVRRRLKSADTYKGKVDPILSMLADKYGCKIDDLDALVKAIEDDDAFYEEEALRENMSVAQLKQFKKIQRENRSFREAAEAMQQQQAEAHAWSQLQADAEKVKLVYPGFNLETEIQNPAFNRLIKAKVPMQTAFEVIHKNEIIPAAMQLASQKTAQNVANAVAANRSRPTENGLASQAAAKTGIDISKLSRKEMEEYKARARRGESITFKN